MLKRTTGRFLLTVLVITGLAGTVKNTSLNSQERKSLITDLKATRSEFLNSTKDLSDAQLDFRPSAGSWSIRDCIYHATSMEKELWSRLDAVLKEPALPDTQVGIDLSNTELQNLVNKFARQQGQPSTRWKTASAALSVFKTSRTNHIKYAKSTTEDLHNRYVKLSSCWLDGYQFMQFMAGYSGHFIRQINEIKSHPVFPKE
jgi:hypothetical protein